MNPNKNHASPQAQKIDNLIESRQPTGILAADDLANTVPQANPDFQHRLEDRLIAQMQVKSTGEEKLTLCTISTSRTSHPRRFYIPLTLAVAMLAVMLVGSLLVSLSGKSSNINLALLVDETVTPTPVRMVNVLIARQNLSRGYQFPSNIAELEKVVGYAPWPEAAVPPKALVEAQSGLEQLAGRVLHTDVFREQIILTSLLAADPEHTLVPAPISGLGLILNQGTVAIALPMNLLIGMSDAVQVGTQVDISAFVTFVGGENSASEVKLQKIVRNATVLRLGDYLSTPTAPPDIMVLATLPDEAETLIWLVDKEIPMRLELSGEGSYDSVTDRTIPEWQDSRSTIPFQEIIWLISSGVKEGDHVSISAEFIFMNIKGDNTIQVIPTGDPIVIIPTPQQTPVTVSKVVINDAEVMNINRDDNTVTFAVSAQEAITLRWLLDAKIPLALKPPVVPDHLSTIAPPDAIGGT